MGALVVWILYGLWHMTHKWVLYHAGQHDVQQFGRLLVKAKRRAASEFQTILDGNYSRQVAAGIAVYASVKGQSPVRAILRYYTSVLNHQFVEEWKQVAQAWGRSE